MQPLLEGGGFGVNISGCWPESRGGRSLELNCSGNTLVVVRSGHYREVVAHGGLTVIA